MKVIIDLIEDIADAIDNNENFSLSVMSLKKDENSQFQPVWQSDISGFSLDEEKRKLFLFLGKTQALKIGAFCDQLNALENKQMMYEVNISYTKEDKRIDAPLIGFGESLEDKKYLLFIK